MFVLFIASVFSIVCLVEPWLKLQCQYKAGLFEKATWKQKKDLLCLFKEEINVWVHAFAFNSFIAGTIIKWCPVAILSHYDLFYKDVMILRRVLWKHAELVCITYAVMCPVYM